MNTAAALDRPVLGGPAGLWLALLAGPVAAALQVSMNYALVKWACAHGGGWALGTLAATLLVLAATGAALALRHLTYAHDHASAQLCSAGSRRLLAITAVGLDVLVAIFLVNSLVAIVILSPCE